MNSSLWPMLCHLSALLGMGCPLGSLFGPLIIWLLGRENHEIDHHGKESVNFQITVSIYLIAMGLIIVLLWFLGAVMMVGGSHGTSRYSVLPFFGGIALEALIALWALVMVVRASLAARVGTKFRYPLSIRFIK